MPLTLSAVTPSFNQAAFLSQTLACVRQEATLLAQTNPHHPHRLEHFIRDNASTDGTPALLARQDFAHWVSTPDRGQAAAINAGWAQATGDIFTYLCADDLWVPGTVQRVLTFFSENPEIDILTADYYFLEGTSGWLRRKTASPVTHQQLLHRGNFISQPATFWRRHLYDHFGGLDETLHYCLDHEYWLRLSAPPTIRWHYLPEPLGIMRLHAEAKTARAVAAMAMESARMQTRYHRSWRPWFSAWSMRLWGCHYYRAKRSWFQWRGHHPQATPKWPILTPETLETV